MGESQAAVPAATAAAAAGGTASCSTLAYLAMHPIGVAVAGGLLIGLGAYYLGKSIANRQKNKEPKQEPAAAVPAAA